MSIGKRLTGLILSVLVLCLGGMTFWINELTRNVLTEEILSEQLSAVQGAVESFSLKLDLYQYAVKEAAVSAYVMKVLEDFQDPTNIKEASARLERCKSSLPSVTVMGVINANGLVVASTNPEAIGKQNLSDRSYFKEAMQGRQVISEASLSRATGKPSFFIANPVRVQGNIKGVIYQTVDLEHMTAAQLGRLKIGQNGYAFLSAPPGKTLAHPDAKRIFEDTSKLPWMQDMLRKKTGTLFYSFADKDRIAGFAEVPQTGWLLALAAESDDVLSEVSSIRTAILVSAGVMLVLVSGLVFFLVRDITRALGRGVVFARAVAAGDFTHELHSVRKDEIGDLGRALQLMLEQLREMVQTSQSKTREAEEAAREAHEAMHEADEAKKQALEARRQGLLEAAAGIETIVNRLASESEELASQIEQASRGADEQRERAGEAASAMEEMNAAVVEVAQSAGSAEDSAEKARSEAVSGAKMVQSVTSAIGDVKSNAESMISSLNSLGVQADGIGQIMSVISDIADQTNLLALNAAIEAARAGEAGRGFAVVADEVRKLAEKTMTATKQVGDAVTAIQSGTHDAAKVMDQSGETIMKTTELAEQASAALNGIVQIIGGTADQVRSIAVASRQQTAASNEITKDTEQINRIATETASSMNQSARSVAELANMAQELNHVVEGLKRG